MKKLLTLLAAPVVALAVTAGASAQSNVNNTGPGSTNTITNNSTKTTTVVCINNSVITNTNTQTSSSGSATSSTNTTGGSATSGSSSNTSVVSNTVNGSCAPGTTPVPAGSPAAVAAAAGKKGIRFDTKGNLLPSTGVSDTVRNAAIAIVSTLVLAGGLQFALRAQKQNALR